MAIESIERRKKKFTNKSIEGTYGFSASGSLINVGNITGPMVVVGLINFDGNGGGSVKGTANTVQPGKFSFTSTSFSYQVNPDGTGTKKFTFILPNGNVSNVNLSFVIVNNGKEILDIRTDTGVIASGLAKRQE